MDRLLKPEVVAELIGCSRGHIFRMVARRKIPFCKIGGSVRFRQESIERWIAGQEIGTIKDTISRRRRA